MNYQLKVVRRTTEVFVFIVEAVSMQEARRIAEQMVTTGGQVPQRSSKRVSVDQCHGMPKTDGQGAGSPRKDGDV